MFHENLRLKRKERGLSQEELASRLHVVRQTISKGEKGMSVPDSEQLIKIAVILETTVSELLGTQVENEEEPNRLAKELSRINTQLAIRNHRTRRVLKIIAVALLVFAALIFAIMALNYAPMSQSKYTKRDAALLLPNRTDVISVSIWNGLLRFCGLGVLQRYGRGLHHRPRRWRDDAAYLLPPNLMGGRTAGRSCLLPRRYPCRHRGWSR